LDRPETGGLSGSTLEETVSWGKMKGEADHVTVIGEALMVFTFIVASATERFGEGFKRNPILQFEKSAEKGTLKL
jgi:deoxyhypusine synthase